MIIAITVVRIINILLLVIITIIINNDINSNGNVSSKSQVIWLKKPFLRLCLKLFKLLDFFNVSRIWFQNEGPIKDKAFWLVFVFRKAVYVKRLNVEGWRIKCL